MSLGGEHSYNDTGEAAGYLGAHERGVVNGECLPQKTIEGILETIVLLVCHDAQLHLVMVADDVHLVVFHRLQLCMQVNDVIVAATCKIEVHVSVVYLIYRQACSLPRLVVGHLDLRLNGHASMLLTSSHEGGTVVLGKRARSEESQFAVLLLVVGGNGVLQMHPLG